MGADVAASPHCPVAVGYQAWEARQSAGRFRVRDRAGGSLRDLRGPSGACAPSGFPAGSPSGPKPWRFATWQIRNRGSGSRHRRTRSRSSAPPPAGRLPAEAFSPAWQVHGRGPGSCRFRSSRAEAWSCPAMKEPKPCLRRWQRADLRPASAGQMTDRSPSLPLGFRNPKVAKPLGALRSLPLSHPLKASPQLPHGGGFVSRPGLRSSASLPGGTIRPLSLRLWLGRRSTVAGRSSRPRIGSCHGK